MLSEIPRDGGRAHRAQRPRDRKAIRSEVMLSPPM